MTDLLAAAQALRSTLDAAKVAARIGVTDKLLADELDDADIVAVTPLFPPWATATAYSVGDIAVYDGDPYKVVQAHTSQDDWTPDVVPALFTPLRQTQGSTPDPWVQPLGAQDAYQIGDRVTYNGSTWESTAANNVWAPGVFGWVQV